MPSEERYIKFSFGEVQKALAIYAVHEDMPAFPEGNLLSVQFPQDDEGNASVFVTLQGENDNNELELERRFFASSLVFLCQGEGIPLPRKGTKILSVLDDKIVMKIEFQG